MINNTPINQINVNGHSMHHNEANKVNRRVEKVNKTSFNQTLLTSYNKSKKNSLEKKTMKPSNMAKTLIDNNVLNNKTTNNNIEDNYTPIIVDKELNVNNDLFNFNFLKSYVTNICNNEDILKLVDKAINTEELLYIIINYIIKSNI